MMKIPVSIRSLLNFWKDSSNKKDPVSQTMIANLVRSIQEITSKAGMASGGILSDLRTGLLLCLPVLENHLEYLESMADRKQLQRRSDIASAVDCVVKNINEREKIQLVEIGEKEVTSEEVKKIVEALSGKDFYEPINL